MATTLTTGVVDRVREALAVAGEPVTPAVVAAAVRAESGGVLGDVELLTTLRVLDSEFAGTGVLQPLLADPDVTDVLVTGPAAVWVDRGHGLERTDVRFPDPDAVRRLAQRLAMTAGRRLDEAAPFVDARLPDGTRLHAVLPPVALDGVCLSLRAHRPAGHDLAALARLGSFGHELEAVLRAIVAARLAFLVVGGAGTGKTTLLAALLGCVPATERIVTVEDASELRPDHPHVIRLVSRPRNIEGAGEITLRDLVRQALRMRPDRIVVGEVRGAEVCELLASLNTGHDGGAGTLHANSAAEVPARLEALAALGGMDRAALHSQLAAAVQVVLQLGRLAGGQRRLTGIGVLDRDGALVRVRPVWRDGHGWSDRAALGDLLATRRVGWPC